ncbi:hypothetical protein HRbin30_01836 [bacterium HR30]|nr:hypothetical protein HRbin30_01836 [bacterium HR30]
MRTLPARLILLLLLIAAVATAVWWRQSSERRGESASGAHTEAVRTVAVFPLTAANEESESVASGVGRLLAHRLSGNGPWRRIPGQCLRAGGSQAGAWTIEAARMRARELGAAAFVVGHVQLAQNQIEVEAQWFDLSDPEPRATARATGALRGLTAVVDRVAEQLEAGRIRPEQVRIARVAAVTSDSLPALLAFFAAEEHLELGQLGAAEEALDRAVEADPQFALAYYRLAEIAGLLGDEERAAQARQNALLLSNRLPVQERALSELLVLRLRQQLAEAEQGYRSLLGQQPSEWEAWCALGELAKLRGDLTEVRKALEQVRRIFPSQGDPCGARAKGWLD